MNFGKYQKLIVALFAATAAVLTSAIAGASTLVLALVAVTTFGGALGVYAVPNQTPAKRTRK